DASLRAIGGYCPEILIWWRYDLTPDEIARTQATWHGPQHNAIDINLLELLGMVMTAWTMTIAKGDGPTAENDTVYFNGDNASAVAWVNRCGGTRDPRAAALMRLLGTLNMRGG
ncbi:unnamed protein product, partial [Sphacelaria rigidula]